MPLIELKALNWGTLSTDVSVLLFVAVHEASIDVVWSLQRKEKDQTWGTGLYSHQCGHSGAGQAAVLACSWNAERIYLSPPGF